MRRPRRRRGSSALETIRDSESRYADAISVDLACREDPGWLIEAYFAGRVFPEVDPDTIVAAWLVTLPPHVEPPNFARALIDRLKERATAGPSSRQRRLLDLLTLVGAFERVAPKPPSRLQ